MKILGVLLALLAPCVPTGADVARDTGQATRITLGEAISAAMRNQVQIITARNNVTIAKARAQQARSAYLPQVSLQNNLFHSGTGTVLNRSTNGTAIDVTQNFYDGGLREANAASARYGVTQTSADLARTKQTVVFSVTAAYYDALRSKHLASVAEANVKYAEELKAQVEYQAQVGTSAKADVLPVESQLANARVSLLSAQNAVLTSLIELQNAIGLSPQAGFDIAEVESAPEAQLRPLRDYLAIAAESRPDVVQAKAGLRSASASARAARISLYPRPVITGQYQRGISGGYDSSGGQIVGGFAFDIFDGGSNRAAYRQAQASQANAAAQEAQVHKDIAAEVEQAYLSLTSAKERLAASEVALRAAQSNYDAQKERYAQGLGITLDLLNAEVQLVTARTNEVQARYDYYTAISQLDYATGTIGGADAS